VEKEEVRLHLELAKQHMEAAQQCLENAVRVSKE
jgi:hypothetical protein